MAQIKQPVLKRIARDGIVAGFYVARFCFRLIPFRIGVSLGGLIGRACFHLLPYERRIARKNIALAFPEMNEKQVREAAKGAFENLGISFFEILNMHKIRRVFDDYVEFEGEDVLRRAVKSGKGCVYITGHIGNWELMAAYLAYRGFHITPIAKEIYDPRLNDLLVSLRAENGVHTILRDRPETPRKIIRALKNEGILGMLIDQDTKIQGIFVDFFGKKAYTTIGPASIANKFKCAVVSGFIHRVGAKHKLVVKHLELVDTGAAQSDIQSNTALFSKSVEDSIREYPEQWVWMHNRWKSKPSPIASNATK